MVVSLGGPRIVPDLSFNSLSLFQGGLKPKAIGRNRNPSYSVVKGKWHLWCDDAKVRHYPSFCAWTKVLRGHGLSGDNELDDFHVSSKSESVTSKSGSVTFTWVSRFYSLDVLLSFDMSGFRRPQTEVLLTDNSRTRDSDLVPPQTSKVWVLDTLATH